MKTTRNYRAAGGVVLDASNRVLLLVRDVMREGKDVHEYRLPKGHIDPGETEQEAALRETCEESGYCDLEIAADLGEDRSEYNFEGRHYVRDERYFLMRLRSARQQPPQPHPGSEEALFHVEWAMNLTQAEVLLTYPSEQTFVRRARQWIEINRA